MSWRRATGGRLLGRLAATAVLTAVLAALAVLAAPVTIVAAGGYAAAWAGGWPPRRLMAAAAWCLPMLATWLVLTGVQSGWSELAIAPYRAWHEMWHLVRAGSALRAAASTAPAAIPLGLMAAATAWQLRIRAMAAGGGRSPATAISFDRRLWLHQVRSARARIAAPGSVPLATSSDLIGAGAVIRSVGHRTGPIAAIGYQRLRSHQVIVGTTGTGKTTLLLRLWAGFMTAGLHRHAAGLGPPPLLVVLDCKGGADSRRIADRTRRVLRQAGARSTAIWPDEASLSLWSLPPRQLTTTLVDLIEHGTGGAAYYTDVMEALVGLAVQAPCGPPAGSADLLERLEPGWLSTAYAETGTPADHAVIAVAARQLGDVALRFRTLFGRLGPGLDGPGGFADADAWYCVLEGTAQIQVAEAQARALVDLLASFAVRGTAPREILLAVDEFSAVARRLPIWQLYERARSLGLAVQVSAQSWAGLAATEDERNRIVAAAEGGVWLLRTPRPEPVTTLAGTTRALDTSRDLIRYPLWSKRGSARVREIPVADPALIRGLDTGQAAYIYRGGVTYVQVKRLVAGPAAVGAEPATGPAERPASPAVTLAGRVPPRVPAGWHGQGASQEVGVFLDAAFGPEPRRGGG